MLKKWEGTSFDSIESFKEKLNKLKITYACIGEEICPTTGRPHCQFYIETKNRIRLSTIGNKKNLNCTVFPLRRKVSEAINYIIANPEKPNPVYTEIGVRPLDYDSEAKNQKKTSENASKKETNKEILDLARTGNLDTIAEKHPGRYLLSYQTLKRIHADNVKKPLKDNIQCVRIEGHSGCGKTQFLKQYFQNDDCYFYNKNPNFYERYESEQTLIIDDLDKSNRGLLNHLKTTCDTIPILFNVKFGSVWSNVRKILITTQYSWASLIGKNEQGECLDMELEQALSRRFTTFVVIGRDEKTNDLFVCFKDDQVKMFPFSLRNYLLEINFI